MANDEDLSLVKTIYHVEFGAQTMFRVDATSALSRFPDEWSDQPWPESAGKGTSTSPGAPIVGKANIPQGSDPNDPLGLTPADGVKSSSKSPSTDSQTTANKLAAKDDDAKSSKS